MFEINSEKLQEYVRNNIAYLVERAYSAEGGDALRGLLCAIHEIYDHLDIEHFSGDLVVFRSLKADQDICNRVAGREVLRLADFGELGQGPILIEITADGRFFLWNFAIDGTSISDRAVVYKFSAGTEGVYAHEDFKTILKLAPSFRSMFAIPNFAELSAALDAYRRTHVKDSGCKLFCGAWHDGNRLFFTNGPEHLMRDSLYQYLRTVLADADVLPEQNVDDSQPIDIKVTWRRRQNLALIEIKWLGKSVHPDGRISVNYTEARAHSGAKQLVGYLEANKPGASGKNSHGYLVVFDGRRKGLAEGMTEISHEDGLHYENQEIAYDSRYLARPDFKPPTRMFAHPISK